MTTLFIDIEGFSTVPIKHGHHRYAEEAEVLLVALAVDDWPVTVCDVSGLGEWERYAPSLRCMIDEADEVVIHNSAFDRTVLAKHGVVIPIEKITDTMVLALQHGLPGKLEMLCDILGVPADKAKDKAGKKLIQLFTKPRPKRNKLRRATRETHPDEWSQFIEYARLDVDAMRDVYRRLPRWNDLPSERELWRLDQDVNDRGFAVDADLAVAALRAFSRTKGTLATRTGVLTGGLVGSTTQRDRLLTHLADELGYDMANMTKATVGRALDDPELDPAVRELLEIRQQASATSPAKYQAVLNGVSEDGRLRGTVQFAGASRTLRDAGRLFQPQNLPRTPDWFDAETQETVVAAFKADCEDLLWENVSELCAFAVRGTLIAEPGNKLVIADLSNIEGRVLAWGAGEAWKIEAFKAYDRGEGHDLYKITAGRILGKDPGDVTKAERQLEGKVSELAGGFGGSLGAYRKMGGKKLDALSDERIMEIVTAWRAAHPRIKSFWYAIQDACRAAIENPGDSFSVRDVITFDVITDKFGTDWLRMKLPHGGYLTYCRPRIDIDTCHVCCGSGRVPFLFNGEEREMVCVECNGSGQTGKGSISYEGVDQYTRQWKRLETYYGRLVENWTQAVARNVFMSGFRRAMGAAYKVVLRVHDELVAECPDTDEWTSEKLSALMATNDYWNLGLPLAAAGHEAPRYRKSE